ncbi:acyltransferase [Kribbella turkmenica]|uniref:Acyltransferase n=1 Tax=Kribbella turkmenica TaxID=2530375 RepID=A0A4V2YGW5_9ACTN|nr:acyltransferase [Kribbella turkmenica]TDD28657.1 acyltransferase [Kribbella turkmenica]
MTPGEPLRLDFLPWEYARIASDEERERQLERQQRLVGSVSLADTAYVAESAAVYCEELRMGERSYIAAHAYVTGHVSLGADTTINPFSAVRGRVTIGDAVRIGAHTSLLAFNHGTAPGKPIFRQPHTSLGITVGDDVWIGSNVTVLDGVTIGPHSIIGAGAVVTKDVPANAIAAGNPARVLRSRETSARRPAGDLAERLAAFTAKARDQVDDVLRRCWDGERFVDRPGRGHEPQIRPWCDAVEIADVLVRRTPEGHPRDDLVRRLRHRQDPESGLVSPGDLADAGLDVPATDKLSVLEGPASYHILCVGYALQVLDSCFEHPIRTDFAPGELERQLDNLPWERHAWSSGSGIDALGTALARNLKDHGESGPLSTLLGWLVLRADPGSGMWGRPHPDDGWLQVVNGFYRLTRGTYAQFGLPLPYPEQAVRTVLAHSNDKRMFSGDGYNSCNVLDVIHPLWLAGKQTDSGRVEGRRWAEDQLGRILDRWVDGQGFAFAPDGTDDRAIPGLQGTEMWLAVIWLLSDYLDLSDAVGYRPRGVHRPEPLVAPCPDRRHPGVD